MKIKLIFFGLIFVAGIFLTSCNGQANTSEELPDIGTIHIGYLPILPSAPFFIAYEKGYYAEQGLNVELQNFNSAAFMMPLLATGDLDVGCGQAGTELFNALDQGLDIQVVGGQSQETPGHGMAPLLVRKDHFDSGQITEPADLKGAKIAINVERGLSEFLVVEALSRGGLTLDDVEIITMPFPDMNAAFANQAIDAAHMVQPLAGQAINDGNAVMLINGDEFFEDAQSGLLYFGKRILDPANREVGIRLQTVWLKAVRELYGEGWRNEENVAIISKYTNIPVPAILHGVEVYFGPNGEFNESFIDTVMMYYFNQGYTELSEPLPMSKIMDTSFMEAALERIGPFDE